MEILSPSMSSYENDVGYTDKKNAYQLTKSANEKILITNYSYYKRNFYLQTFQLENFHCNCDDLECLFGIVEHELNNVPVLKYKLRNCTFKQREH